MSRCGFRSVRYLEVKIRCKSALGPRIVSAVWSWEVVASRRLLMCSQAVPTSSIWSLAVWNTVDSCRKLPLQLPSSSCTAGLCKASQRCYKALTHLMCERLNQTGQLCGKGEDGLEPAIFSCDLKCLECLPAGYSWLIYVLVAFCFNISLLFHNSLFPVTSNNSIHEVIISLFTSFIACHT